MLRNLEQTTFFWIQRWVSGNDTERCIHNKMKIYNKTISRYERVFCIELNIMRIWNKTINRYERVSCIDYNINRMKIQEKSVIRGYACTAMCALCVWSSGGDRWSNGIVWRRAVRMGLCGGELCEWDCVAEATARTAASLFDHRNYSVGKSGITVLGVGNACLVYL